MSPRLAWWTAACAALLLAGAVVSHDLPYTQAQPGKPNPSTGVGGMVRKQCGIGNHPVVNLTIGGVCFGAGTRDGWANGNWDKLDPLGNPAGSTDPQHISDTATALIDVADAGFPGGIPATYCQNLNWEFNEDLLCGGNATGPGEPTNPDPTCRITHAEGKANCLLRSEPYVDFCDSITIRRGLSGPTAPEDRLRAGTTTDIPSGTFLGTWADPTIAAANWDLTERVEIYVSAPMSGNPLIDEAGLGHNPCGTSSSGWGTSGHISHT